MQEPQKRRRQTAEQVGGVQSIAAEQPPFVMAKLYACNASYAGSSRRVSYLRRGRSTASRACSRFPRLFSRSELSLSSTSARLACSHKLNFRSVSIFAA